MRCALLLAAWAKPAAATTVRVRVTAEPLPDPTYSGQPQTFANLDVPAEAWMQVTYIAPPRP